MKKPTPHRVAAALLLVVATSACSSRAAAPANQPGPMTASTPPAPAAIEFMTGMIHHHAQAIEMAKLASTHGAGAPIRTLSERIVVSQTDEIDLMSWWLKDNGQPAPVPNPRGMRMVMGGMEHDMLMPGMLTEEQMKQLDQARGPAFDRLFLTFMIQHHQGAIQMVDTLFNSPGGTVDDTMYKVASDVFADQDAEIDRMQKMLDAMPSGPGGTR